MLIPIAPIDDNIAGGDGAIMSLTQDCIPRQDRFGHGDQAQAAKAGWIERVFEAIQVSARPFAI